MPPLVLPCLPVELKPGSLLRKRRSITVLYRPLVVAYAVEANGRISEFNGEVDTAADYTILKADVVDDLKLKRVGWEEVAISGAGGTYTGTVDFPPEGTVSLFVTDFTEYLFIPAPLIGFHPRVPNAASQRSVMGLTGFLEYARSILDPCGKRQPLLELHPCPGADLRLGRLPKNRPLEDIIRDLRAAG